MRPDDRQRLRHQLIRLREGDRSAFRSVYDTLLPIMLAFARRMVGETDAQDVVQQAMMKLFAQVSRYDETKSAAAWALSLTAWECRTVQTRVRRRGEVPLPDSTDGEAHSHDPREALFDRKVLEEARAVLRTLTEADQATLISAFRGEGRGSTFRKRKQRALHRLIAAWRTTHG